MDGDLTLLSGLRVVEIAGRYSGRVAGSVLAALGADVTRLVTGPDVDEYPLVDPAGSASALAFDRHKRIVTVARGRPPEVERAEPRAMREVLQCGRGPRADGAAALERLLADGIDVLLTSGENEGLEDPASARRFGLSFDGIQVDVSPYGLSGPHRDWRGTDLTLGAHAGLAVYVGEPARAPIVPPVQLVSHQAGLAAAAAALAAPDAGLVEVAEFDVMATTHMVGLYPLAFFAGAIPRRAGRRKPAPYPFTHLPCADGWVCVAFLEGRHWGRFLEAMGNPGWATDERYRDRRAMGERYPDEVDALVTTWLRTKTKAELRDIAIERGIPIAPLRTFDDLLTSDQLATRNFFESVEVDGASVRVPGLPFHVTTNGHARSDASRPFAGRLVLDLGRVVSAPAVGQWFADLGADVIKVESHTHLDSARKGRPLLSDSLEAADAGQTPNLMPFFISINRGKRSLTLDLADQTGRDILIRLVHEAAVVVENFGAGGLERFGLGPADLHAVKPDLVIVRVSAVGQTGPEAALPGYAPHSTAGAGLDALCGYGDAEPVGMIASNFGDINAGAYGAVAALAALRAGTGCTIDLSMLEANAAHLAPALAAHQLSAPAASPSHRCHRVGTEDGWVAVAAELNADVEEWIAAQPSAADVAARLQADGIPAAPALGAEDLLFDEHVRARDLVVEIPHKMLGIVPVHGCAIRGLMSVGGAAPDLGEHTTEILARLGLTEAEISSVRS